MYLGIGTWDVTSEGESVACLSTCSFLEPKLTLKKTFDLVRTKKRQQLYWVRSRGSGAEVSDELPVLTAERRGAAGPGILPPTLRFRLAAVATLTD